MKLLPLTKGFHAQVDDADFEWLSQWKWSASQSDGRTYAMRMEGGRCVYMHRAVNQTPAGFATDHIDGDTLNNQRANLRSATPGQNAANTRAHRDAVSRFKGVSPNSKPGVRNPKPWVAQICVAGKQRRIGQFATEEEAAAAYDAAALEAFGQFNPIRRA